MASYWPWWLGGLALAAIALLHWLSVGSLMSVSSRFTGIVERARGRAPAPSEGASAEAPSAHAAFFVGVVGGGIVAALVSGTLEASFTPGVGFARLFGGSTLTTALVMLGGGALVGAGTRMARGCTSGHGLCGVARAESGSLASTVAFFGTGVVTSLVLRAVLA